MNSDYNFLSYGAVGDGVTDCTAAWVAARADIISDGGGVLDIPSGDYLFTQGRLAAVSHGMAVHGAGSGRSTFLFSDEDGGITLGRIGAQDFSGGLRGLTVNGMDVAINPILIYWILGWELNDVECVNGGYSTSDPANSAAWIIRKAQNIDLVNVRSRDHQHHNVVGDQGVGGLRWSGGQIGRCGMAGYGGRHLLTRATVTDPQSFDNCFSWIVEPDFIEFSSPSPNNPAPGDDIMCDLLSAQDFVFQTNISGGTYAPNNSVLVNLSEGADGTVFDGCNFNGRPGSAAPPGNDTGIIGIDVQVNANANAIVGRPAKFSNLGVGIQVAATGNFAVLADPRMQPTVQTPYAGDGLNRLLRPYPTRVDTPPAASAQTRGRLYFHQAVGTSIPDAVLYGKRGSSATAHGLYDLLGSATATDFVASTWVFKGELKRVNDVLMRSKVDQTTGSAADLSKWEPVQTSHTEVYTGGWPSLRPVPLGTTVIWIKTDALQPDPDGSLMQPGDLVISP